jgi:hypothetical protein
MLIFFEVFFLYDKAIFITTIFMDNSFIVSAQVKCPRTSEACDRDTKVGSCDVCSAALEEKGPQYPCYVQ